jgi:hypothetical protein
MSSSHAAVSPSSRAPLRRTDESTWVDGLPIEQYADPKSKATRFEPHTPMPNRSADGTENPAPSTPLNVAARKVGTMKTVSNRPTNDVAHTYATPTNPQTLATPARSQAAPTPARPQDPPRAADSAPTTSANGRRPDVSKNPVDARNNVASNELPPHRPRTTQPPGQSSNPSHTDPNVQQMPANATASIANHGDRQVVGRSQAVATARSVRQTPHNSPGTLHHTSYSQY